MFSLQAGSDKNEIGIFELSDRTLQWLLMSANGIPKSLVSLLFAQQHVKANNKEAPNLHTTWPIRRDSIGEECIPARKDGAAKTNYCPGVIMIHIGCHESQHNEANRYWK